MILVALFAFISAVSAVTQQCDGGECPNGSFCVENKFCLDNEALQYGAVLFTAGVASAFVTAGDVPEAQCLVDIEVDLVSFVEALQYWQQGDYVETGSKLLEAVKDFQTAIADCVGDDDYAAPTGGFWDALWDGIKWVIEALCPECDVLIDDAHMIVAGVEVIEDWYTMSQDCLGEPTDDQLMDCGAAFGDVIVRISEAARADLLASEYTDVE